MKVWFMFDGHTFSKVGEGDESREQMYTKARELFALDGCGSLFARDGRNNVISTLHGKRLPEGKWGVADWELVAFFDVVDEHLNWEARG